MVKMKHYDQNREYPARELCINNIRLDTVHDPHARPFLSGSGRTSHNAPSEEWDEIPGRKIHAQPAHHLCGLV